MTKALKDNIVRLFQDNEELPDVDLDTLGPSVQVLSGQTTAAATDLTGKPKVIMAIGAGSTGKTTLLRWIIEQALLLDDGNSMALASVDPVNRELHHYFPQAMGPRSYDPAQTAVWLERFLSRVMATQKTAAVDFGGGDVSLSLILAQVPNLQMMMERAGVEPVALHLLSPRVSDLVPMVTLERAGFKPKATALVLNLGRLLQDRDPEQEFAQLRKHAVYRAAVERGAVEVSMPRLYAAQPIENRRIGFHEAANGSKGVPLNAFDQWRVRHWLEQMAVSFAPIASWLV